jgi:hypothetical protein
MKTRIFFLYLFLILFPCRVFSQNNTLELDTGPEQADKSGDGSVDSCSHSFFIDAGSLLMPVRDVCIPGLALKIGGRETHFASGLAFDYMKTDKIFFSCGFDVVSPEYKYIFFGWYNEYVFNPKKRISISLHLKAGLGYMEYSDKVTSSTIKYYEIDDSSSYYTPVYEHYSGLIISDNFLSIEPGINVLYNLASWMSIGMGWNSRIVFGINRESPVREGAYYSGNIFFRLRMPGKRD